jgi:hypothetical protein
LTESRILFIMLAGKRMNQMKIVPRFAAPSPRYDVLSPHTHTHTHLHMMACSEVEALPAIMPIFAVLTRIIPSLPAVGGT